MEEKSRCVLDQLVGERLSLANLSTIVGLNTKKWRKVWAPWGGREEEDELGGGRKEEEM